MARVSVKAVKTTFVKDVNKAHLPKGLGKEPKLDGEDSDDDHHLLNSEGNPLTPRPPSPKQVVEKSYNFSDNKQFTPRSETRNNPENSEKISQLSSVSGSTPTTETGVVPIVNSQEETAVITGKMNNDLSKTISEKRGETDKKFENNHLTSESGGALALALTGKKMLFFFKCVKSEVTLL